MADQDGLRHGETGNHLRYPVSGITWNNGHKVSSRKVVLGNAYTHLPGIAIQGAGKPSESIIFGQIK